MKTLYFDCFAGASGNMILGGLFALGVCDREVSRQLASVVKTPFEIQIEKVSRAGICATHVNVKAAEQAQHRSLRDIRAMLQTSNLSDGIKHRAEEIFVRLAEAEADVHGVDVEAVHFHEVGALDAIIDVVGACIGFEILGIERFLSSPINVGSGFVETAHGTYPVPPPAVLALLQDAPIYSAAVEGELTTPTGAAIITTVCSNYERIPNLNLQHTAYGAGTRSYPKFPNALRLIVAEMAETPCESETLILFETNIDDASPQILGLVMERSLAAGALDCWFTPIQMKKNRPGTMLSILCMADSEDALKKLIYTETTSIGLRRRTIERESLERKTARVKTPFGAIDVKVSLLEGCVVNVMPEYEQVRAAAEAKRVAFGAVFDAAKLNFNTMEKAAKPNI